MEGQIVARRYVIVATARLLQRSWTRHIDLYSDDNRWRKVRADELISFVALCLVRARPTAFGRATLEGSADPARIDTLFPRESLWGRRKSVGTISKV
jgi:hypothetical protein